MNLCWENMKENVVDNKNFDMKDPLENLCRFYRYDLWLKNSFVIIYKIEIYLYFSFFIDLTEKFVGRLKNLIFFEIKPNWISIEQIY